MKLLSLQKHLLKNISNPAIKFPTDSPKSPKLKLRFFKAGMGMTPKKYAQVHRAQKIVSATAQFEAVLKCAIGISTIYETIRSLPVVFLLLLSS